MAPAAGPRHEGCLADDQASSAVAPRRGAPACAGTLFAHQDRATPFIDEFVAPWLRAGGPALLSRHLRSLDSVYTQTVAPFVPRLTMPAQIVWGRRGHQMQPPYAEPLADDLPAGRLTWVEDASHFVPADRPDVITEATLRLVQRA